MKSITHTVLATAAGIVGGYLAATALAGVMHYGCGAPDHVARIVGALSLPFWVVAIGCYVGVRLEPAPARADD